MASPSGKNPHHLLFNAAKTGNIVFLKQLATALDSDVLQRIYVDAKDSLGRTALHFAAGTGKTHVCKYLALEMKVDLNVQDVKGYTPLTHAIMGPHHETAVFLIENGACLNVAGHAGYTALHVAAESGLKELVQLLITKGAEVEAKCLAGTPVHCAASRGKEDVLKILLDSKANPNSVNHHIFTPLVVSILARSYECTSLLLKAGADPNLGSQGGTPLGLAASEGQIEVIKCLLEAGADPNVTDFDGFTPLEIAALGKHEVIKILLPRTSQIATIPDWSLDGIMMHVHSEEGRRQREEKKKESFWVSKSKGEEAFKQKDYIDAIYWYTKAIEEDPSDATVLSNRSLCWAKLNEGSLALSDAQACVMLRPDWTKAHYREGVAWGLLKEFARAAMAFSSALGLDPNNEQLISAFREAVKSCGEKERGS